VWRRAYLINPLLFVFRRAAIHNKARGSAAGYLLPGQRNQNRGGIREF
jgi:hypothetical protein